MVNNRNITRNIRPTGIHRADILAYLLNNTPAVRTPGVVTGVIPYPKANRTALTWIAVPSATSYDVESSASVAGPFTLLTTINITSSSSILGTADFGASVSALTYYRIRAKNDAGVGPYSTIVSSIAIAAAVPTASSTIPVPMNLRRKPLWLPASNSGTDILTWDASAGALTYVIYEYDLEIGRVSAPVTTFTVPSASRAGLTYTVSAITTQGQSIVSDICAPSYSFPPNNPPSWAPSATPNVVQNVLAVAQWNLGHPTVLVRWGGQGSGGPPFNIYRDRVLIASGMTACNYVDNTVVSGIVYSYTITSVNEFHPNLPESAPSAASTVTALLAQLSLSNITIPITRTVSRDDSVFVLFNKVAGAIDYVCFKYVAGVAPEILIKNGKGTGEYRGTPNAYVPTAPEPTELCIQMNDLDPVNPTMLQLVAIDKLARFQTQDGMMTMDAMNMTGTVPGGPGSPNMNNDFIAQMNGPVAIDGFVKNGQGDPSNAPNIIALSAPFSVSCAPFALTGTDGHGGSAFLDRFRSGANEPIVQVPIDAIVAQYSTDAPTVLINNPKVQSFQTPNWNFINYALDNGMTKLFFMPHFMSVVYDGGGPGAPFNRGRATANNYGLHIANGSMTMQPRAADGSNWFGDITGGKVLHVTMEVDAHVNGRRFMLITLKGKDQKVFSAAPTKMHDDDLRPENRATTDANFFAWIIGGNNDFTIFKNNGSTTGRPYDHLRPAAPVDYADATAITRISLYGAQPRTNGTARELDKMHRFHLYISHTRMRIVEETPEGPFSIVYDRPFGNGITLPFDQIEPVFVQEVYHTAIDALDGEQYGGGAFAGGPENMHWINNRPYADERHWDNMGAEVLDDFPFEPLDMHLSSVAIPANTTTTIHATFALGVMQQTSTYFSLGGATAGSSVTGFTATSPTTADVVIHAGAVGTICLVLNNDYYSRSILVTIS